MSGHGADQRQLLRTSAGQLVLHRPAKDGYTAVSLARHEILLAAGAEGQAHVALLAPGCTAHWRTYPHDVMPMDQGTVWLRSSRRAPGPGPLEGTRDRHGLCHNPRWPGHALGRVPFEGHVSSRLAPPRPPVATTPLVTPCNPYNPL